MEATLHLLEPKAASIKEPYHPHTLLTTKHFCCDPVVMVKLFFVVRTLPADLNQELIRIRSYSHPA